MSYAPTTDFLALLRQTSGGVRTERMPGLDYVVAALARTGMIALAVGQTAPIVNQSTTAWFKSAIPSWSAEGALYLWNATTIQYELATPALWSSFFTATFAEIVQDVITVGPVNVQANATVVRVQNVGAPVALVMPLAASKQGPVLVSDWANLAGTNNITISRSGADVFPNGATTWTLGGDGASVFLRPVPGGYAL